jgi:citrate lyase beta subunit
MTPLASEIYRQLVRRVRTRQPSITYAELAALASKRIPTHQRSRRLHAALSEVTLACRAHGLPCLPAIVWRKGTTRPSDGYFKVAYPKVRTERGRAAAWAAEHDRVLAVAARYPARL